MLEDHALERVFDYNSAEEKYQLFFTKCLEFKNRVVVWKYSFQYIWKYNLNFLVWNCSWRCSNKIIFLSLSFSYLPQHLKENGTEAKVFRWKVCSESLNERSHVVILNFTTCSTHSSWKKNFLKLSSVQRSGNTYVAESLMQVYVGARTTHWKPLRKDLAK